MFRLNKKSINILMLSFVAILFFSFINNPQSVVEMFNKIIGVFSVFIIGGVIAFFLNPVLELLEGKFKMKRKSSISFLYLALVFSIVLFVFFVVPKLAKNISDLVNVLPKYIQRFGEFINKYVDKFMKDFSYLDEEMVKTQLDKINRHSLAIAQSALKLFGENIVFWTFSIFEFIVAFIFSIFFLGQKEYFRDFFKELSSEFLSEEKNKKMFFWLDRINGNLLGYLNGKTLDCFIIGLIAFVFLMFMKIPYSVFLWLFITITNFIPYFGPFMGMCLATVITLFTFPHRAFFVFLFLLALQQFDAWFLEPRILGNKLKLKMFWTVAAVTLGGKIAGVIGIILAAPVAGFIKEAYELRKKGKEGK